MIVELISVISNRLWMEIKINEPKDALAGAGYDAKTSLGGIG